MHRMVEAFLLGLHPEEKKLREEEWFFRLNHIPSPLMM